MRMACLIGLCVTFSVGPATSADWTLLRELPEAVSKSEVVIELESGALKHMPWMNYNRPVGYNRRDGVLVEKWYRPKFTVADFVRFLTAWESHNYHPRTRQLKFLGWYRMGSRYRGVWSIPFAQFPDAYFTPQTLDQIILGSFYVQFTHLLSKDHGGGVNSRLDGSKSASRLFKKDDPKSIISSEFWATTSRAFRRRSMVRDIMVMCERGRRLECAEFYLFHCGIEGRFLHTEECHRTPRKICKQFPGVFSSKFCKRYP